VAAFFLTVPRSTHTYSSHRWRLQGVAPVEHYVCRALSTDTKIAWVRLPITRLVCVAGDNRVTRSAWVSVGSTPISIDFEEGTITGPGFLVHFASLSPNVVDVVRRVRFGHSTFHRSVDDSPSFSNKLPLRHPIPNPGPLHRDVSLRPSRWCLRYSGIQRLKTIANAKSGPHTHLHRPSPQVLVWPVISCFRKTGVCTAVVSLSPETSQLTNILP